MTPSRTVVIGSALPLLVLAGLVGVVCLPRSAAGSAVSRSAISSPAGADVADPQDAREEASAVAWLRRSLVSGRDLGFSGTEVVLSQQAGGWSTRVLTLSQQPGGVRISTAPAGTPGPGSAAQSQPTGDERVSGDPLADPLTGLSGRVLDALAAGYQLRVTGPDTVAGRPATVVAAARDGRELARWWLDDATGLLLRQDVVDRTGRLQRRAAFRTLRLTPAPAGQPADRVAGLAAQPSAQQTGVWTEVDAAALSRWRAEGWPCPAGLAAGFVLLDVRRGTSSTGAPVLQLTYGDGLSAISVFLQHGQLDASRLTGLSRRPWGTGSVLVRDGSPEVLVWQGGDTVITAIGDDHTAADLQGILSTLPRQPNRGTLGSLRHGMGSALAWFKG